MVHTRILKDGIPQAPFLHKLTVRTAMHLKHLTAAQVLGRVAEESDKSAVEVLSRRWHHICDVGARLRHQHVVAHETHSAVLLLAFSKEELPKAGATQGDHHPQAESAILLHQHMFSAEPQKIGQGELGHPYLRVFHAETNRAILADPSRHVRVAYTSARVLGSGLCSTARCRLCSTASWRSPAVGTHRHAAGMKQPGHIWILGVNDGRRIELLRRYERHLCFVSLSRQELVDPPTVTEAQVLAAREELSLSSHAVLQLRQACATIRFAPHQHAETLLHPVLPGAHDTGDFTPWLRDGHCVWMVELQTARARHRVRQMEGSCLQDVPLHPRRESLEPLLLRSPEQTLAVLGIAAVPLGTVFEKRLIGHEAFATQPAHHWWSRHGEAPQLLNVVLVRQGPKATPVSGHEIRG